MKHLLLTATMMTALPAYAGGPVIEEETYSAPADRDNSWIVPVVIGLLIVGAVASGGGDDAPAGDPGPKPCAFNGDGC